MTRPRTTYALDLDTSSFVIEEYNWAPAFSNFLPGIAGAWGIPLWAYYVNRGQAMTSVGVRDKDGQILEFYSLNKAVMRIEREGAPGVLAATAYHDNKTPAAFVVRTDQLAAGAEVTQSSVLGHVPRDADLLRLLSAMRSQDFFHRKRSENAREVAEIGGRCFTVSSSPTFDAYAQQNFLDNVVRGGMPKVFQTARGPSACYLFGRRHGGLERDYHHFVVEPTYLSQGNGFYRDVLQNRRSDTLFFPEVEDANLVTFLNLSQLDGYNPLGVDEVTYRVADQAALRRWLRRNVASAPVRADLRRWSQKSFSPGQLVMRLEADTGRPVRDRERVAREVLAVCAQNEVGSLHEGFWSDHWHYNFDLLDAILKVFPDRLEDLLVGRRVYTFFDDPDVVLPRSEKTVAVGAKIRCYGAVIRDREKERYIRARNHDPYTVRTRYGRGTIYRTTLLVKLLCLVTNRLGTLDPAGTGIEMEAGKPGWNDALNGLPGLFGSGLSELLELRRALRFMRDALARIGRPASEALPVYEELARFVRALPLLGLGQHRQGTLPRPNPARCLGSHGRLVVPRDPRLPRGRRDVARRHVPTPDARTGDVARRRSVHLLPQRDRQTSAAVSPEPSGVPAGQGPGLPAASGEAVPGRGGPLDEGPP